MSSDRGEVSKWAREYQEARALREAASSATDALVRELNSRMVECRRGHAPEMLALWPCYRCAIEDANGSDRRPIVRVQFYQGVSQIASLVMLDGENRIERDFSDPLGATRVLVTREAGVPMSGHGGKWFETPRRETRATAGDYVEDQMDAMGRQFTEAENIAARLQVMKNAAPYLFGDCEAEIGGTISKWEFRDDGVMLIREFKPSHVSIAPLSDDAKAHVEIKRALLAAKVSAEAEANRLRVKVSDLEAKLFRAQQVGQFAEPLPEPPEPASHELLQVPDTHEGRPITGEPLSMFVERMKFFGKLVAERPWKIRLTYRDFGRLLAMAMGEEKR